MNRGRNLTAALLAASLLVLCAAYQAYAAPTVTAGGLLQFTSRNEFERAFFPLPKEDFEESPIAADTYDFCTGPITSSTNQPPNCFVPGDILPGLSIDSDPGHHVVVVGAAYGTLTTSSVTLASDPGADILSISFSGSSVNAVGMDLAAFIAGGTYTIKVYGSGNVLLDTLTSPTVSTAETFFGLYSSQNITKITLDNGSKEIVDNIQFKAIPQTVTFYTSKAAFTAAHPGLPVEDFEESPVPSGGHVQFPQPLDSTTNAPAAFSPGDIVEGLRIQTVSTADPTTALTVIGDHYAGQMANASKMVCSTDTSDNLGPAFPAYAVGMDILPAVPSGTATQTAFIVVYGGAGRFLGTTTISLPSTQETFLGLDSNHLITGANITISSALENECIDNIQFGGSLKDLTFYQTEADFRNAAGTLLLEDFSEGQVPDNTFNTCKEPIDSSTNQPGCFWAGDILPGISFQTENSLDPACPDCIRVYGRNAFFNNTTPMIMVSSDLLEVSFSGRRIDFVGMKSWGGLVSVYGTDDALLGSAMPAPPLFFWGVVSRKPIGRITIYGIPAIIDDIMFGTRFPWPMFLPAIHGAPATP